MGPSSHLQMRNVDSRTVMTLTETKPKLYDNLFIYLLIL